MNNYFLLLFIFVSSLGIAQNVVLHEHVSEEPDSNKFGQNRTHYMHSYVGYGFIVGQPEGAGMPIQFGNSGEINWGLRYKNKWSEKLSGGLALSYTMQYFRLAQTKQKIYPDTLLHAKERFNVNHLNLEGYIRFNFDKKRGDVVGTYLDFGAYGSYIVRNKHYYKDEYIDPQTAGAELLEVTNINLTYMNKYSYGATVRFGHKSMAVYAKYRISDLMNGNRPYPELPRFSIGIELGALN